MDDTSIIKIAAIVGLTAMEIVNLLTMRIDGAVLIFVSGLVGGLAGYEFGRRRR